MYVVVAKRNLGPSLRHRTLNYIHIFLWVESADRMRDTLILVVDPQDVSQELCAEEKCVVVATAASEALVLD